MNATTVMESNSPGAAIENLYPALAQCFAIILCGYFAGRMNLISETEAKGINTFVGTFSLPSLIFMSLAQLDLSSVNWLFLLSVLLSKSVVFFSVIVVTLLVGRPVNYGRAGIFAIFCTQSNDFAVGYPIVDALYKNTHPEYASYLYLMAPISLAILNPLSFVLMEIEKRRRPSQTLSINSDESPPENNNSNGAREQLKMIASVAKNIFLNPVIMMTILGILGNLIFKHVVPSYLGRILEALGSAFSASALFLLGLRMVGKVHKLKGAALVVPGVLIIAKLLVLPLVTREVISLIHAGANETETLDLSTYGFLYGTFPSAPTVFVFATQYSLDVDLIASAMVACTFISAPFMFVSAKMIAMTNIDPSKYINELEAFTFDISIISTIACLWVIFIIILAKKITKIPHKITTCLIISQLLSCVGAILWNWVKEGWFTYVQFTIFTTGVYSTRLWTAFLAITLLFLQCRSLCFVLKLQPLFFIFGWGLPLVLSIILLLFDVQDSVPYDKRNPNFVYGLFQKIIAVTLLVLCFIVTAGCLILHQRYQKRYQRYLNLANDVANNFEQNPEEIQPSVSNNVQKCGGLPTIKEGCCEDSSPVIDIEDLGGSTSASDAQAQNNLCPTRFGCQGNTRVQCEGIIRQYQEQIDDDIELIEEEPESHDPQILRHVVLLILLLCSMFVGIALCIWTLVMEKTSGIYIELSFLDATLNFGQSIIVFAVFGLDSKEILLPILKYWRKFFNGGATTLTLPTWHELTPETRHICDQFINHHIKSCKQAIASDKRWGLKTYKSVFSGVQFVDWLIDVGLARDRVEAVNYARHLIEGKVLKHINSVHHFYDRNLLYTFV